MNDYFVHDTSIVDTGATIGRNTKIWHWCHISSSAKIGENCVLGQNVYVGPGVEIGNGVKIQNNVSVFEGVTLEDEVFCGPSMVFTNVLNPRSGVNKKSEFKKTLVRHGATLGANCTIVCGNTIGAFAFIGAGSVINRGVKNYALMVGVPGEQIGWVTELGDRAALPLSGNTVFVCPVTQTQYQLKNDQVRKID